jgi:glutamate--cysteine ligase
MGIFASASETRCKYLTPTRQVAGRRFEEALRRPNRRWPAERFAMTETGAEIPIRDKRQLVEHLEAGCKPRAQWRTGVEYEKFVCRTKDLCPAAYYGPGGIADLLGELRSFGWRAANNAGPLIGLVRGAEKVSLEPGGQLEHADAPASSVHTISRGLHRHLQELSAVAGKLDLTVLGIGFEPLYPAQVNTWIPQERFLIMRAYMPKVGRHGLDMMQRTASIQISLDYSSEQDMVRKYRVALALQPLATALCASSPFSEGRNTGYQSYRSFVWSQTDRDRCGIPQLVFDDGMGFERYVDWALAVPMYSVIRNGHHIDTAGQSFHDFCKWRLPALPGELPLMGDWERHLPTLSPEARIKQVLELRGADSGPLEMSLALAAFWTGLLYDSEGLDTAEQMIKDWDMPTRLQFHRDAARHGMAARVGNWRAVELAEVLLDAAQAGLRRRARLDSSGADETVYLRPLYQIAQSGDTLATVLLADGDPKSAVFGHCNLTAGQGPVGMSDKS